jgi:hypothetical protein
MPRRLGDDPLSRKKPLSAKDATSARPGPATQQTSHNDVFFRRRVEGPQPIPEGAPGEKSSLVEPASVDEKPEISEVVDIVRTATALMSTEGAERLVTPVPMNESVHPEVEEPDVMTEQVPSMASEPDASPELLPPVAEEPAAAPSSQPETQPEKSEGFFKRLFGRFGK